MRVKRMQERQTGVVRGKDRVQVVAEMESRCRTTSTRSENGPRDDQLGAERPRWVGG